MSALTVLLRMATAALLLALLLPPQAWGAGWPLVELPADADAFAIGEQVSANGLPMRMRGFFSKQDVPALAAWFKARLGQPLMEDRVRGKLVLGRAQGDHYITIQLEPAGGGTRGLVGISDMRRALEQRRRSKAFADDWARDLPGDTRIVNFITSQDDGKASVYLVATNRQSDEHNVQRAVQALQRRGFAVQRSLVLRKGTPLGASVVPMSGRTVLFKSPGREASLMAFRDESGRSAIVINTTVAEQARP